jgi:WD40 repeat protein
MSSSLVERQETSMIKPIQKFEGRSWVFGALYLPDGQCMMTCSFDSSLRVWNLKTGKQTGEDWRDGDSAVWTIALSPDGKKVVSGSEDGGVRLWDIDTGKVIAKWMVHTKGVESVCWSRDGQRVVSGYYDGTARVWDVEMGLTILGPIDTGYEHIRAVVYSPDMTLIATSGRDGSSIPDSNKPQVKIWDAKTGKLVATLKGHTNSVMCLAWTPDGKILISGSSDYSIRTWNTSNWKQIAVLDGHTNTINGIAISPNGRILASASFDTTARLWNLDNSQPIQISLPLEHVETVYCVSFSADGKLLATGCFDKNAYVWDISPILNEAGLDDLQRDESLPFVSETFINSFHI